MQIVYKTLDELIPYENNPRNNDNAVDYVVNSIKEFGFKVPVVIDENNVIVTGHTRLKAAQKMNLKEIPCIIANDLTETQIKAFRLADNKVSEIATWNEELLNFELEQIENIDMSDFNFDIDFSFDEIEDITEDEFDVDKALEETEPVVKRGEVWKLGNHYLMCGDSTSKEEVMRLMCGHEVDMLLTDPPYNVDYEGVAGKIQNDKMNNEDFKAFLIKVFNNAMLNMKNGSAFYVWFASREHINFETALNEIGLQVREELIWIKNSLVMGRQDYHWKHEPCLYGWKDGAKHNWYSDRSQTTTLEFDRPTKSELHPTMKPIELFAYLIRNSTKKNDIVLDLFAGSGTTLIACEQLNRISYNMELDERYCDVIIKRFEEYTGKKAELISQ